MKNFVRVCYPCHVEDGKIATKEDTEWDDERTIEKLGAEQTTRWSRKE